MTGARRRQAILFAALVTALIWAYALLPRDNALTVTFLDVGDGLCTVVRSPTGRVLVMDCGTSSWRKSETIGEKLVAPYLQRMGIDAIDVAVLSHPHADHTSGWPGLLALKPAKLVLDTGAPHGSPQYKRFLQSGKKCGATYRRAARGQYMDLGGGVRVDVLNPDPGKHYSDLNDNSIVLRILYGDVAFMLAADAGADAERDMLETGLEVRSQVLQVGHHGSEGSSTSEWISAVGPDVAVISCARNSRYGHPSKEVTSRLKARGCRVYITGKQGAVVVTTDGAAIRARACGGGG